MRLDHLLSREYTTTDLVRVAWREGSFEFVVTSFKRSEELGAANFAEQNFPRRCIVFKVLESTLKG